VLISKEAQRCVRLSISILPLTSKRGPETTLLIQYPQLSQTCLKQHCKHSLYRLCIIPYCTISLSLSLSSCASDVILVLLQYCVCLIEKEKGGDRRKCRCVRTTTSVYLSLSFFLCLVVLESTDGTEVCSSFKSTILMRVTGGGGGILYYCPSMHFLLFFFPVLTQQREKTTTKVAQLSHNSSACKRPQDSSAHSSHTAPKRELHTSQQTSNRHKTPDAHVRHARTSVIVESVSLLTECLTKLWNV
jgi:hypothetical protein